MLMRVDYRGMSKVRLKSIFNSSKIKIRNNTCMCLHYSAKGGLQIVNTLNLHKISCIDLYRAPNHLTLKGGKYTTVFKNTE